MTNYKQNYVMLTTTQLRQIIALSQNRTLDYRAVIDHEDGSATVAFCLDEEDEEAGNEPEERYELKSAQPYAKMQEAAENVAYLLEHPAASVDFKGLAYWAKECEEARNNLLSK